MFGINFSFTPRKMNNVEAVQRLSKTMEKNEYYSLTSQIKLMATIDASSPCGKFLDLMA